MTDSTRRALRTAYQAVLAFVVAAPLVVAAVSAGAPDLAATLGSYLVAIAAVSKVLNALEDAGVIPAWLKGDTTAPAPVEPAPAPVPDAPTEGPVE